MQLACVGTWHTLAVGSWHCGIWHVLARVRGGDLASLDFGANPTGLPRRRAPEHVDLEILRGFGCRVADLGERG